MKKLLMATAALSAGLAMADIVSSDVVGYQNLSLAPDFNYAVNTFVTVGKTKAQMTFADIGVENVAYMGTTIQLLTDGGATATVDIDGLGTVDATYTYATSDVTENPGWYLLEDYGLEYPQGATVLPLGQGYCIDCQDADAKLIFAGTVSTEDTEITLAPDFNYTGNCSPAEITFGDVVPSNINYMGTTIQFLTDGGATATVDIDGLGTVDATYTYATSDVTENPGWYLLEDYGLEYPQNDLRLPAGQGFCVDCQDADATITIPAAL